MGYGIFRRPPRVRAPQRKLPPALFPTAPVSAPPLRRARAPWWSLRRKVRWRPWRRKPPVAAVAGLTVSAPPLRPLRLRTPWLFRRRRTRAPIRRRLAPALFQQSASIVPLLRRYRPKLSRLRLARAGWLRRRPRGRAAVVAPFAPSIGSTSGLVFHYSGQLVPDSAVLALADPAQLVFDKYVWQPVSQGIYEAPGITLVKSGLIRTYATFAAVLGPGETGKLAQFQQIRYAQSTGQDPAMWTADGNPMWAADPTTLMWAGISPWQGWTKGTLITGYVQHRQIWDFTQGLPLLQQYTPVVDQPPLFDAQNGVIVSAGGSRVNFINQNFLTLPYVRPQVSSGSAGVRATASAIDNLGFTGHVFDASGSDIGGTIDYTATNGAQA